MWGRKKGKENNPQCLHDSHKNGVTTDMENE